MINKNKKVNEKVDYKKLICAHSNGRLYYFNDFTRIEDLGSNIYSGRISIKQVKNEQNTMEKLITNLHRYKPKKGPIKN